MPDTPTYARADRIPTLLAAIVAALLVSGPTPAHADPPRIEWVRGEGAASCPGADVLRDEVMRRSDGRLASVLASSPSVEAVVTREDGGWVARVFLRDAAGAEVGRRDVRSDAPTCRSIVSAVALAALLALEPGAAPDAPADDAPAPITAPPPPPIPHIVPVTHARAPTRRAPPTMPRPAAGDARVLLGAAGSAGAVPTPVGGGGVAFDARVAGPLRVAAGLALFTDAAAQRPAGTFTFGLAQAWVLACAEGEPVRWLAFAACAGASGGLVHASATAPYVLVPGGGAERPWGGPSLGARISIQLVGPLVAQLGLDATVPIVRYAYTLATGATADAVFAQPLVVALGFAGLGIRFR